MDLQRLAEGIEDPFDRALVLGRLARRATQANDQAGAGRYAEATSAALALAGFPPPSTSTRRRRWGSGSMKRSGGAAVWRCQAAAADRPDDSGYPVHRHVAATRADPAQAAELERLTAALNQALARIVAEPGAVATGNS